MNLVVSALLFVSVGALFAALAIPLMRRRVKPNWLYGVRIRSTFADEWVWYEANARSGRDMLGLGVGTAVLATGLLLLPGMTPLVHAVTLILVTTVGTLVMAVTGIRRANRLLRDRQAEAADDGRSS